MDTDTHSHLSNNNSTPSPKGGLGRVSTIGSFDGVHKGHRFVLQQVIDHAHQRGLSSCVVTFTNHPLKVLRPDFKPQLLTLADEKQELLRQTGVDDIVMLDFTKELSLLSAREFMEKILKQKLNTKVLIIGYDNHFGHGRRTFSDYVEYGKELGIEVVQNAELPGEKKVSSTIIRNAIMGGDITTANEILGYNYYIKGKVVSGFHIGRKIGFPTANIEVDDDKLIPMNGAYLVKVEPCSPETLELGTLQLGTLQPCNPYYGMMNIGHRPTLDNGSQRSIEVNLFGCNEDLYGKELKIEFLHFLRQEHKFADIDELTLQLTKDKQRCEELLKKN